MKILILFLLVSCAGTATHITKPDRSQYAPSDYRPIGEVSYLNQGYSGLIAQRREDAFRKAFEACNGKYVILREGAVNGAATTQLVFGTLQTSSAGYWNIQYECK